MNKAIYSYSPLREKRKKQKKERMEKVIIHSILLAIFLLIVLVGSICTGDYEGDPDAECVRIINLKK